MLKGEIRRSHPGELVGSTAPTEVDEAPGARSDDYLRAAWVQFGESAAIRKSRRRGWMLRRALALADAVGLTTALLVAEWVVAASNGVGTFSQLSEIAGFILTLPLWILVAKAYGLYDQDEERTDHSAPDEFSAIFHMVTVCTATAAVVSYLSNVADPTPPKLIIFWSVAIVLVVAMRSTARAVARRSPWYLQNTLILGAGDVGQKIARKLLQHREYGLNLLGFVDDHPKERRDDLENLTVVGGSADLREIVELLDVERVIVAFSGDSDARTLQLIRTLNDLDVQIDVVPRLYELVSPGVGLHTVQGIPLVGLPQLSLSRSSQLMKRLLDVAVSSIALAILAPFFLVVAAAVKLDSRGPAFFRQTRMGSGGKPFTILKFRTMACQRAFSRRRRRRRPPPPAGGARPALLAPIDSERASGGSTADRWSGRVRRNRYLCEANALSRASRRAQRREAADHPHCRRGRS